MPRQRGRKSAAALSTVPVSGGQRPNPPEDLGAEEAEVWRATVDGMRADWFGAELHPILRSYCALVVQAESLRRALRGTDVRDKNFGRLADLHARTARTVLSLATKLRLTPASNRQSKRDGRDPSGGEPPLWEYPIR